MCGITGYWYRSRLPEQAGSWLQASVRSLAHRGPDDRGTWERDGVGLGQTRLSILDLSPLGHQPMVSRDGAWVMVFNGEVYNFRQLRTELEALGHTFSGCGDSEVILAGFAQWGPQAVRKFIGMFAIALWSVRQRRMYLLRDRLGVKPLYYGMQGADLVFGSELKALRAYKHWDVHLDREAMADFFSFGYIVEPRSIYEGVRKLPPGHWSEIDEQGPPRHVRYWNVLDAAQQPRRGSEEQLTEELEALMVDAFKLRMIADVPVGVFLSGGIDSSVVTALLQKHSDQQIRTFTIGFDEQEVNEAPYAEAVAAHLGTQHKTQILQVAEAMRILPSWGDLYDEPFGDASGIPTLLVSRVAAQDVKVVLSADGGDELFSGYNSYASMLEQTRKLGYLPMWLRAAVASGLGVAPWNRLDDWLAAQRWAGDSNHVLRYSTTVRFHKIQERLRVRGLGELYELALALWPRHELAQLLGEPRPVLRDNCDVFPGSVGERLCLWDLQNYLPGDILTKVDRATMAVSIEGREPLLDHRLVEFAFSLPFGMRRGPLGTKHLLRKVLYRHVPQALIDRPKRGFSVPLRKWLSGDMHSLVDDYVNPARIRAQGLFDPDIVGRVLERFKAGDKLSVNKVWLLLAFQMWHARWMEGDSAPGAAAA
jgi:asparagine synthase (glutamine-hydrolysing)